VGERDLENNKVTVKQMDSGDEEQVDKNKVIEYFKSEGLL
jgi:histidyl-tRNA synthetase